jgi:radical SAM superfamily enzyme YgiQ (UPF0313 family)
VKEIAGMYVPALHAPGEVVRKRTALRLDGVDYGRFPVPYMEIVHDRASIEVMRGCAQGCRFCQAGYLYRPVREQAAPAIHAQVAGAVRGTGYEEVSLSSLSIADLTCLREVVSPLMAQLLPARTSLSLPSLRVEALNRHPELAEEIRQVRKTGFTIAPEAGSARLRAVINKTGFDAEQILRAAAHVAAAGWESLKFYFMIGLPTETQADLDELVLLAREAARAPGVPPDGQREQLRPQAAHPVPVVCAGTHGGPPGEAGLPEEPPARIPNRFQVAPGGVLLPGGGLRVGGAGDGCRHRPGPSARLPLRRLE